MVLRTKWVGWVRVVDEQKVGVQIIDRPTEVVPAEAEEANDVYWLSMTEWGGDEILRHRDAWLRMSLQLMEARIDNTCGEQKAILSEKEATKAHELAEAATFKNVLGVKRKGKGDHLGAMLLSMAPMEI